jgi:hypothetical protein
VSFDAPRVSALTAAIGWVGEFAGPSPSSMTLLGFAGLGPCGLGINPQMGGCSEWGLCAEQPLWGE